MGLLSQSCLRAEDHNKFLLLAACVREDSAKIIHFTSKVNSRGDKSIKMSQKNPISSLPDGLISLYADISEPLILRIQLFWFENVIAEFMQKVKVFCSKSGPIIRISDHFTYVPIEMERRETTYLYGFDSNQSPHNYDVVKILCKSEEEKLALRDNISNALQELGIAAVQSNYPTYRSLRLRVGIGKN